MPRNPPYVPARDNREITLPEPHVMQTAADMAANMRGAAFFAAKMQPAYYSTPTFRGSIGQYEVNDDWEQPWTPLSIMLVNPWTFPIYVAATGDPIANGLPFPPQTSLRVPLPGMLGSLVLAVNESDLTTNDAIVHLFRYATPD